MQTESEFIDEDNQSNKSATYFLQELALENEPIINIKTTLIKPEEVKKYGNRLIEDSNL